MVTTSIFLVIYIHIKPTRLLNHGAPNTKFDAEERLCIRSISLDEDNSVEIKKTIAVDKNNKDKI